GHEADCENGAKHDPVLPFEAIALPFCISYEYRRRSVSGSAHRDATRVRSADVVILGAGLVGLAVAAEASARGASVLLVGQPRFGEASPAGAGMLAPGAESAELPNDPVRNFAVSGRDMYPAFLSALRDET